MDPSNDASTGDGALIRGRVERGAGRAAGFTELPWVRERTRHQLGFAPYPGTLNVRLESPEALAAWERLQARPSIRLEPEPGFCAARCYRVLVEGQIEGAVILPTVADYPTDVIELLAPVRLRDALGLEDGAALTIVAPAGS